VQENEGLQAGDGDTKVGFESQGPLEELIMGRPIGHELLGQGRAEVAVCLWLTMSEIIELAEGTKGKYEVDGGEVTGVIDCSFGFVEVVKNLVKILSETDGTMEIETGEINVDDTLCEDAVLGKPYVDLGVC